MDEYGKSGIAPTVFSSRIFCMVARGDMKTTIDAHGASDAHNSTNIVAVIGEDIVLVNKFSGE